MYLKINTFSSLLNINWVVFLFEAHCILCQVLNETLYSGTASLWRTRQLPTGRSGASRIECTSTYGQLHTWQSSRNPDSNILEPDRPQHDRPATSVTAQQYSSAIVSPSFRSGKENCDVNFKKKMLLSHYCASLKSLIFNCVSRVASFKA